MKKAIGMLMVFFLLASCSNDDNLLSPGVNNQISNNVQSSTWRITYFNDSGKVETEYFSGFEFSFEDNGVLKASNGSVSYTGSWSISSSSNSGDDDSLSDLDFNIAFNLSNKFEELTEDWEIISQSDSKIELIHVSGGNGGTDYLTFEKI